jgi:hypothetical protein
MKSGIYEPLVSQQEALSPGLNIASETSCGLGIPRRQYMTKKRKIKNRYKDDVG